MNKRQVLEIVSDIANQPASKFKKTCRGLKFAGVELIFSFDEEMIDPLVTIIGRDDYAIKSYDIRDKLIAIRHALVKNAEPKAELVV